jgi:PelA/Pel-15E family pectate lyase
VNARLGLVTAALCCVGSLAGAQGANPNPMDSIRKLPNYRPTHDTIPLLTRARIAKLAPKTRDAWFAYLDRSARLRAADSVAMARELAAAHASSMTRGPYAHDFTVQPSMTPAWFATDSARRLADVILSFEAPNGGWSKHVDYSQHTRRPGESYFTESADWEWISTIDNGATTEEIRFLARADAAKRDERYERAVLRGIDYLLASQFPNGCFPQVYPLQGSYHDAATFNDDATINVLKVLREVGTGTYPYASADQRKQASAAVWRGVDCILAAQVQTRGTLTAWGQQHDPLTLEPTSARSYELTSLSAQESASILDFLMTLRTPNESVVDAVRSAVAWLQTRSIRGYSYSKYELKQSSNAPPLWGRLYEIETNRVIMANRDGIKLYDWNKLTDRRSGYAWYTTKPAATLAAFEQWSRAHPRKP